MVDGSGRKASHSVAPRATFLMIIMMKTMMIMIMMMMMIQRHPVTELKVWKPELRHGGGHICRSKGALY